MSLPEVTKMEPMGDLLCFSSIDFEGESMSPSVPEVSMERIGRSDVLIFENRVNDHARGALTGDWGDLWRKASD